MSGKEVMLAHSGLLANITDVSGEPKVMIQILHLGSRTFTQCNL